MNVQSADLLRFLEDPRSYPHRPGSVRVVQTHASYVAIAPPYVYKVKKPLDLGFLDFSTLEKRRHFCEREVALNRRLCPDTYLGVVGIARRDGKLSLETEGEEIVEYAVKMRQLPEEDFLHRRLERGEVGRPEIERIVERLTEFYRGQTPSAEVAAWGRLRRLKPIPSRRPLPRSCTTSSASTSAESRYSIARPVAS